MSFTLNDIALLLIALVTGLILGLMISGRGKYRRLWREEQAVHRAAIKDRDVQIDAAHTRLEETEKRSLAASRRPPSIQPAGRDDLKQISGISKAQEIAMNEFGYHRYGQIATLDAEREAALELRLGLAPGTIVHEHWREQARLLDCGRVDAPVARFATPI